MEKPLSESSKTTSSGKRSEQKTQRRFPRIECGQILAETAKRIWTRPDFIARDTDEGTEFVFRVPIKKRFNMEDPGLYHAFFGSSNVDWEMVLNEAFEMPLHDGKKIATMIDSQLYTVFLNALDHLYRRAEALGPKYVQYIQKHSKIFKGQARRSQIKARSAKQLKDGVIIEWTKSYARRKDEARAFISFINERRSKLNDKELLRAAKDTLRFKWIKRVHPGDLLRPENLLAIPSGEQKRAWPLSDFSLTERQLALAIVRDDFLEHHPDRPLTPRGLDELVIQRGNKLIRAKTSP